MWTVLKKALSPRKDVRTTHRDQSRSRDQNQNQDRNKYQNQHQNQNEYQNQNHASKDSGGVFGLFVRNSVAVSVPVAVVNAVAVAIARPEASIAPSVLYPTFVICFLL